MPPQPPEAGFTLLEAVVATALALTVVATLAALLNVQVAWARVQPATADLAQRSRATIDLVAADLAAAGSGIDVGGASGRAGGLGCCLPVIQPRRLGLAAADPPGVTRADAITVSYVPSGAAATVLASPLVGSAPPLLVVSAPPCPPDPLCGLDDEDTVLVFDRIERHDYFIVRAATPAGASLVPRQPGGAHAFPAGAAIVPVQTHTYYFDAVRRQLRHYDGRHSDVPAVDHVVGLSFRYAGERAPPARPRPPPGVANCLYDDSGSRWPAAAAIGGGTGGLVDLPLSLFGDGPWCGSGDNRFDLDLLRVRRVQMTVTLQAPGDLRAPTAWFHAPGSSTSALRMVADLSVTLDVTPRNLNAGR